MTRAGLLVDHRATGRGPHASLLARCERGALYLLRSGIDVVSGASGESHHDYTDN